MVGSSLGIGQLTRLLWMFSSSTSSTLSTLACGDELYCREVQHWRPRQPALSLIQHGALVVTRPEDSITNASVSSDATIHGHSENRQGMAPVATALLLQAWGTGGNRGATALLEVSQSSVISKAFLILLACGLVLVCFATATRFARSSPESPKPQPEATPPHWPADPQPASASGCSSSSSSNPVRWPSPDRPRPGCPQGGADHHQDFHTSAVSSPMPSVALLGRTRQRVPEDKLKPITSPRVKEDGFPNASFCPDLIVPEGNECCLEVPVPSTGAPFSITDPSGQAVLRVVESRFGPAHRRPEGLTLMANSEKVASCRAGDGEFGLHNAVGDKFATLLPNKQADLVGRCFTLTTKTGVQWKFSGSFERHVVDVVDVSNPKAVSPIAKTELSSARFRDGGERYRLRVGPGADVGLVLCAFLCIDHLDASSE